ncbi:hypothetical protein KKG05_04655, partial [bacterium]|nr:hypothetical protein [bacterium]
SATREQYLQSGFIAQLPFRTTAEVYFEDILRRDQLFPIDFDTRARSMNLRMSYALRILSFNVSAKRGTWDDFLVGEKEHLERYRIGFSFSPDSRQSYTGSYQTGHSGFSIGAKQSRTASFTARCNLIRRLSLLATVQKSNWGDQSNFENDQVRLDVRYLLPNDHGLSFRFRNLNYRREGLADGLSYILSYDIPLGVPVGKQRRLGSVKGKICDAEDPEQKGVSGVLLTLGDMTTVTDNKGNYTFSSVKRGAHYLQLDNASIGLDRTTAQKLPMQVYVRGGRSEKLDLNVIRSASIRGEVALFGLGEEESRHGIFVEQRADSTSETKEDSTLHRLQGVSDIQLELRSEQETLVEITDRLGRFSFHNLRPGKWVLHVSSQGLPAYHDLEQDSYELDIEPGGTEEIAIRVIPRIRHIIIQEEGKIPVISGRSK